MLNQRSAHRDWINRRRDLPLARTGSSQAEGFTVQRLFQRQGEATMGIDRLFKGGLVLIGLAALWWLRAPLGDLLAVIGNREAVVAYLDRFGMAGPAVLFVVLVSQVIVAAIPGHILMISGAYVYGFVPAFLINIISTVGGSQIAFHLAQWAGRPVVERLAPSDLLEKWRRLSAEKGILFFTLSFMLPIFPADVMNYVAGLSPLKGRQFFIANLVGRLPGVLLFTTVGAYGYQLSARTWLITLAIAAPLTFMAWRFGLQRLPSLDTDSEMTEQGEA